MVLKVSVIQVKTNFLHCSLKNKNNTFALVNLNIRVMKKINLFLAALAMVAFVACNNAVDETATEETATEDVVAEEPATEEADETAEVVSEEEQAENVSTEEVK